MKNLRSGTATKFYQSPAQMSVVPVSVTLVSQLAGPAPMTLIEHRCVIDMLLRVHIRIRFFQQFSNTHGLIRYEICQANAN